MMLIQPPGSKHKQQLRLQAPGTFVSRHIRCQRFSVWGGAGSPLTADHRSAHFWGWVQSWSSIQFGRSVYFFSPPPALYQYTPWCQSHTHYTIQKPQVVICKHAVKTFFFFFRVYFIQLRYWPCTLPAEGEQVSAWMITYPLPPLQTFTLCPWPFLCWKNCFAGALHSKNSLKGRFFWTETVQVEAMLLKMALADQKKCSFWKFCLTWECRKNLISNWGVSNILQACRKHSVKYNI